LLAAQIVKKPTGALQAMLKMQKMVIADLHKAFHGA
jgi:hypothetical protein